MLDIQALRKDTHLVVEKLKSRGFTFDAVEFLEIEKGRKLAQVGVEETKAKLNSISKRIGILKSKGEDVSELMTEVDVFSRGIKTNENGLENIQFKLNNLLLNVPNLPHESVPVGKSETDNVEVRKVGTPHTFHFAVKDHTDVGKPLGLDFDTGIKLSGARFTFMRGKIAKLHRALSQFMLDTQEKHGYEECYTPYIVNAETLRGTGQLPKFEEDLFKVPRTRLVASNKLIQAGLDDLETGNASIVRGSPNADPAFEIITDSFYLIPTSEVTLTNTVRDEIVPLEALPIKLTAHTPCFRSEAGSYGKDSKGMISSRTVLVSVTSEVGIR